jgi:hypothetical protein
MLGKSSGDVSLALEDNFIHLKIDRVVSINIYYIRN